VVNLSLLSLNRPKPVGLLVVVVILAAPSSTCRFSCRDAAPSSTRRLLAAATVKLWVLSVTQVKRKLWF
ncbi:hypothetical protein A2U01_0074692, partial [Trifolium medium]|nr:hypothetical protein [Trifolium medium]